MHRWLTTAILSSIACFVSSPLAVAADAQQSIVAQWEFNTEGDFQGWTVGGQIADAAVAGGVLRGRTTGNDPILFAPTFDIPARPGQRIEIRMKSAAGGAAELFWTETLEGKYGGFSEAKADHLQITADDQFHVYRIYPFWQAAGKIIRLRFDPPNDSPFEIDFIRIVDVPLSQPVAARNWQFASGDQGWWAMQETTSPSVQDAALQTTAETTSPILASPLLSIPAFEASVACLRMAVDGGKAGRIYYATDKRMGWRSVSFPLRADGQIHTYNVEIPELASRDDSLVFLGISPTDKKDATARIESIGLADHPAGPAELEVSYFGRQEGVNRVDRPSQVVCTLENLGGEPAKDVVATLSVPEGVKVVGQAGQKIAPVCFGIPDSIHWTVEAGGAAVVPISVKIEGPGMPAVSSTASIDFTPLPKVAKTDYIPEPQPVTSKFDIGAFYFPGWPTMERWQPIQDYPLRKPVLGWYDEANPECIDWQIKWAAEHGVKFFLVDWYWCKGARHLEHWVNSYKDAKFRKYLKWCVMWANHNPPHTHSVDDWRKVTQFWIDNYFGMDEYYRIDDRPAVFIWAPGNVRNDLGGSAKAAELYAMSQKMARDAGYKGIYFAAMGSPTPDVSTCETLKNEGFEAFTSYHSFQLAHSRAKTQRFPYADVVETSPEVWQKADSVATEMQYFPLLDTGWASEPWHGNKSLVVYDRTPELFGEMCRMARRYADEHHKKILILGPWNEWGEGSYIEPCNEYGFRCLDQIRDTFCKPGNWPPDLVPSDIGRGPYDLPPVQNKTAWQFDKDGQLDGWMAAGSLRVEVRDGALQAESVGPDPILYGPRLRIDACRFHHMTIRMKCSADDHAQVFWSTRFSPTSEASSVHFDVIGDGQFHDYDLDLGANPHWRNMVTSLRLDPVAGPGRKIAIQFIRLH